MDIPDVDAKLKASRVNHVVATYERISTGRHEVVHHRYGADSLDSHPGGARTLTLPGRIGPVTRESAWKKSASESSLDGRAFR